MKPELHNQCATVFHKRMAGGWDANCRYSDSVQEGLPVAMKSMSYLSLRGFLPVYSIVPYKYDFRCGHNV